MLEWHPLAVPYLGVLLSLAKRVAFAPLILLSRLLDLLVWLVVLLTPVGFVTIAFCAFRIIFMGSAISDNFLPLGSAVGLIFLSWLFRATEVFRFNGYMADKLREFRDKDASIS